MAIDASIALGVKPVQLESPLNQMSNVYALQNAAQSNQLNQMKMDEYKRGLAESESYKQNMLGVDATTPEGQQSTYNYLLRIGKIDDAAKFAKNIAETKNLGLTGQETQGKINEQKMKERQATLRDTSRNPSDANLTAHVEDILMDPKYSEQEKAAAARMLTQLLGMPIPERQAFLASQGASASDLKPNIQMQNIGGSSNVLSVPAYGGAPTTLSSTKMTASPGEIMTQGTAIRGQNLTDAREKQRIANDQNPNIVASTLTDEAGNVTQYNKFGTLIGTKPNVGKPSAQFSKTKAAKQQLTQDLDLAINELENATKKGGLIETATGSGLGALRDMSAGFIGKTTAGAEALGALQPIYDKVLKMVPRFEGPQSDKDTASYNRAAGDLGNAAVPTDKKLAAAKTILRLMKDRKAQFLTRDMAESGTPSGDGVDSSNPLLK
jgi:hypothetical protein